MHPADLCTCGHLRAAHKRHAGYTTNRVRLKPGCRLCACEFFARLDSQVKETP